MTDRRMIFACLAPLLLAGTLRGAEPSAAQRSAILGAVRSYYRALAEEDLGAVLDEMSFPEARSRNLGLLAHRAVFAAMNMEFRAITPGGVTLSPDGRAATVEFTVDGTLSSERDRAGASGVRPFVAVLVREAGRWKIRRVLTPAQFELLRQKVALDGQGGLATSSEAQFAGLWRSHPGGVSQIPFDLPAPEGNLDWAAAEEREPSPAQDGELEWSSKPDRDERNTAAADASLRPARLEEGLVAYYPLDGHARDAAGGHDGEAVGTETTAGRRKLALRFDGKTAAVTVRPAPALGDTFTVTAWVKGTAKGQSRWARFVDRLHHRRKEGFNLYLDQRRDRLRFAVFDRDGTEYLAGESEEGLTGRWQHMAGVVDGRTARFYLDGEEVREIRMAAMVRHSTVPLHVGNSFDGYRRYPFRGAVDEVRLYDRALDAAEIRALCGASAASTPAAESRDGAKRRHLDGFQWVGIEGHGAWVRRPEGWRTPGRGRDERMIAQFVEPRTNGMVEVYATPAEGLDLEEAAEAMERRTLGRIDYLRERISSREETQHGTPGIWRTYRGRTGGTRLQTFVFYTVHEGKAYMVVGVYAAPLKQQLHAIVRTVVSSFHFPDR